MKIVNLINYSKDLRLILLKELLSSTKNIFIYGAGRCAKNTYRLLSEYRINIKGYCVDPNYYTEGSFVDGVKIYNVDTLRSSDNELVIGFENRGRALSVKESFAQNGVKVYYFEDLFCFRQMDYKFFIDNINSYQKAYDLLEDELSKKILVAHINSRIAGDYTEIAKYDSKLKYGYDYDLLQLNSDDTFVDCGAFDGDTFLEVADYTHGRFKKYIAFEPDEKNVRKFSAKAKEYNNVIIIEKGVSDVNEVKNFYNDGSLYSNFVDSGLWGDKTRRDIYGDKDSFVSVPVCRMDDVLGGEPVSVIKMDIEGSELDALKGARQIIKKIPKLAICIYHKSEDLFSCILFINSVVGEGLYKYYIRHHSDNIAETILYAIPRR